MTEDGRDPAAGAAADGIQAEVEVAAALSEHDPGHRNETAAVLQVAVEAGG